MMFLNADSKVIYFPKFLLSHLRVVVGVSVSLLRSANLLGALNTSIVLYVTQQSTSAKEYNIKASKQTVITGQYGLLFAT